MEICIDKEPTPFQRYGHCSVVLLCAQNIRISRNRNLKRLNEGDDIALEFTTVIKLTSARRACVEVTEDRQLTIKEECRLVN